MSNWQVITRNVRSIINDKQSMLKVEQGNYKQKVPMIMC